MTKLQGRTPHGVRGLKFTQSRPQGSRRWSHPSRGAWIEMLKALVMVAQHRVAPLTGCKEKGAHQFFVSELLFYSHPFLSRSISTIRFRLAISN